MRKLIGTKDFYKKVLLIALPIMVQNAITNFVGLLDNLMVGQLGTPQMSGVSIVNQLMFVFQICIFGAVSGAGIFGAQFFGSNNLEGVRNAFRFKFLVSTLMCIIAFFLFTFYDDQLISLYLHTDQNPDNLTLTLNYGKQYLYIMMASLIPFTLTQVYSSTLRESGKTLLPMISGIISVFVNFILNYLLIFGVFGFPKLGVAGAAIATVIARFLEMTILIIWLHRTKEENPFVIGLYKTLKVPLSLTKDILKRGTPLIINEVLWASGMAVLTQCYSIRGLEVVASLNISTTISNVFSIVFIAFGSSISIIVGQLLGAGKMEEAKETARKMIFFSVISSMFIGFILASFSFIFPSFYNTSEQIKEMASFFIIISAFMMPLNAFTHASYFTLRSGGNTIITFLFDSVYVWTVAIPVAFLLVNFTALPIITLYFLSQLTEVVKCTVGFIFIKKGIWLNKFVD